jgi:hypothetical protein
MRDQLDHCDARHKQEIDGSNPDYLVQVRAVEDSYIGKSVDAGVAADGMEELKRSILNVLHRVVPGRHREDAFKVFALDDGPPPPLPEKDWRDDRYGD